MKSLICSILIIFIVNFSYGQFGITQTLGSKSTLVNIPANGALRGGLINRVFVDTTSANTSNLKFYDAAQIKTISPNAIWWRDSINNTWVQYLPGGGGTGAQGWLLNYNTLLPSAYGNIGFGLVQNRGIDFATNNTVRLALDSTGILAESGTTVGLGYDPSDGNKLTQFSGGGGGGGWGLTGNAGTDSGTNFIGTTDYMPLMFRVNNTRFGVLDPTTSIGFGSNVLLVNEGTGNVALGTSVLSKNTTGLGNVGIGSNALKANITGWRNIAIGQSALDGNTAGGTNIAIGYEALKIHTASNSIAIGTQALAASTVGGLAIGTGAMRYDAGTGGNTAVGHNVLSATTLTGAFNTGVGLNALAANTSGAGNTAFGTNALLVNTTGQKNAAFGAGTLENNIDGSFIIAIGEDNQYQATGGSYNTSIGYEGQNNRSTGFGNNGIGYRNGGRITTGSYNDFIGYGAGSTSASQKVDAVASVAIGKDSYTTLDSTIVLGADFIKGVGIGTSAPTSQLHTTGSVRFAGLPTSGTYYKTVRATSDGSLFLSDTAASLSTLPISSLTAATGTNSISNGNFGQVWAWPTLNGNNALQLSAAGSTTATGSERLLDIILNGTNANSDVTTYGAYITNAHDGTNSTNIALRSGSTSGSTNIAAWFNRGSVNLGTVGTESGVIKFNGSTSGTGTLTVPAVVGTNTWTFPAATGTIALTSDIPSTTPISSLTAATGTNTINNGAHKQAWNWNSATIEDGLLELGSTSLSSGHLLHIHVNSTAAAASSQTGAHILMQGANANNGETTYGLQVSNTHSGTTSTNIAGYFNSVSGTNNYAIIVPSSGGSVGIGTSNPTSLLHVNGAQQLGTAGSVLGQSLYSGSTSGTVTVQPALAAGTWTMTLPTTDGGSGEFLQTDGNGVTSWAAASGSGTVNSGSQYRIAYYATAGTAVSEAPAITASRALISDANGVPTHSTTTTTQLQYLNAATGTTGTASTNLVFSTSPVLVTPTLGVATATSINGATITSGTLNGSVTGTNTGDQTINNTSDATSHTVTLSASGGSVQLIEGSNITLTTGGTGSAGTVTIASTGGGGGTVTSVGFTGGLISVADPTTTPAFTVAGTSGGIPYFSSTSTWASSGLLAANSLLIGGGAGLAPSSTTTGTGVLTALGVNTGSAGAFVVNGGVLGTPSSGTLTNATGLPEGGLSLTDITTANTSTSAHGFFPKLTSNSIYYVSNAGALTALALGTSGKVLTSNGTTSAPTFETPTGGGVTIAQVMAASYYNF